MLFRLIFFCGVDFRAIGVVWITQHAIRGSSMSEFFYRFRTLDRLLGKKNEDGTRKGPDEGPRELYDLKIFFASPAQLNDPLEGYKEIFWEGDEIVWENLFGAYLKSLLNTFLEYYVCGESESIDDKVNARTDRTILTDQGRSIVEKIRDEIFGHEFFRQIMACLCGQRRRVYRLELLTHFRNLHPWFLSVTATALQSHNINAPDLSIFKKYRDEHKDHYQTYVFPLILSGNVEIFNEPILIHTQTELLSHCKNWDENNNKKNIIFLCTGFPEKYLDELEKLTAPKWYTACFMADSSNSAMWGGYAENHTGACLKYKSDTQESGYSISIRKISGATKNGYTYKYMPMHLNKVSYDGDHVKVDFFKSLLALPLPVILSNWYTTPDGRMSTNCGWLHSLTEDQRLNYWMDINTAATAKIDAWKYEQEHRLILESRVFEIEKNDQYVSYNFNNLEGVIFGIRTPLEDKVRIVRAIQNHCKENNRTHFNFYQAQYSSATRTIESVLLPAVTIQKLSAG